VPIVLKSGSLNLLEPSGPVKACNGVALPFIYRTLKFLALQEAPHIYGIGRLRANNKIIIVRLCNAIENRSHEGMVASFTNVDNGRQLLLIGYRQSTRH
jgi:hypothetical protein